MAATYGISAWNKYYAGRLPLNTTLKKDSPVYDKEKGGSPIATLGVGTPVQVVNQEYRSRVWVIAPPKKTLYSISFSSLQKPGVEVSANLSPQAFGLAQGRYQIQPYIQRLTQSIEEGSLNPALKNYLLSLIGYYEGDYLGRKVSTLYAQGIKTNSLPLKSILIQFGEVLGPIALLKRNIAQSKGINLPLGSFVNFPSAPNFPRLDYEIGNSREKYRFSAKADISTSNVLKPGDVVSLISQDPLLFTKYKNTLEFRILTALAQNTMLGGPLLAASYLTADLTEAAALDTVNRLKTRSRGTGAQSNKYNYDLRLMDSFIQGNDYLKQRTPPTLNEMMHEAEKILITASKTSLNFSSIFQDAIRNQLIFMVFSLTSQGLPQFDVRASDDYKKKQVVFRSKNGYNSLSDKLGFAV